MSKPSCKWDMHELCFVTTCMGRLAHLQQTLGAVAAQPRCSCVVVDFSCQDHAGDWVARHFPAVNVVRVPNQTYFNPSRARNAGAAATAVAPWLCFLDADVLLHADFTATMLPALQAGNFYLAQPWKPGLTGTVICPRDAFQGIGGYDEVYQSWGEEDLDLFDRLRLLGLEQQSFPQALVTLIEHEDAMRVQHYAIKSPALSQAVNQLYRLAKLDLMRLLGKTLTEQERQGLHAQADQIVRHCLASGQASQWRIPFRTSRSLLGQQIETALTYLVNPPQP